MLAQDPFSSAKSESQTISSTALAQCDTGCEVDIEDGAAQCVAAETLSAEDVA